jgi:hypothetical protein
MCSGGGRQWYDAFFRCRAHNRAAVDEWLAIAAALFEIILIDMGLEPKVPGCHRHRFYCRPSWPQKAFPDQRGHWHYRLLRLLTSDFRPKPVRAAYR